MRSSSSPATRGAPAHRSSLPPSTSMSLPRKATSWSSAARWTSRTSSSSASAAAVGAVAADERVRPAEAEEGDRDDAVLGRLLAPRRGGRAGRWTRSGRRARGRPPSGRRRARSASPAGTLRRSRPPPAGAPSARAGSSAAVWGLTTMSPARAARSIRSAADPAGPQTTGSRCDSPTRNRCSASLWMPTDMRSVTRAPGVSMRPAVRSAARMSAAARHARSACSSPSKNSSSASPPNFSREPPLA